MGVSVGPVYVLGFVLLQQEVPDDLRGRVFSSLNTLVRLCVLISMVAGPLLAVLLGKASSALIENKLDLPGGTLALPGVRLTLWLAALIIIGAGFAAMASLRAGQREEHAGAAPPPVAAHHLVSPAPPAAVGRFVVFEGGEGSGKSTQAACWPRRWGAVLTFEPGGTDVGARLRSLLLDPAPGLAPRAEALLMAADRAQHVADRILPALDAGRTRRVRPLRRFVASPTRATAEGIRSTTSGICRASPPRAWARPGRPARRGDDGGRRPDRHEPDRFEAAGERLPPRVAEGFRAQAAADPDRWVVVDGTGSVDEVQAASQASVRSGSTARVTRP